MKTIIKNITIFGLAIFIGALSINSTYAEDELELKNIEPTTTKTLELNFNDILKKDFIGSDLEIYKTINNEVKLGDNDNELTVKLNSNIEKNTSYSIISLSELQGDIVFSTGDDISGKEINNNMLLDDEEGIKSIFIKDEKTIILNFTNKIEDEKFEIQFLKTIKVKRIKTLLETKNIKVFLDTEISENENYLGTITYLEGTTKVDVTNGLAHFKTSELEKYEGSDEEEKNLSKDELLEQELLSSLEESEELNEDNEDIKKELNSAADDPENQKKSQLEKLALGQKETPDTGAETGVLLLLTFIINTFYYISRRKKINIA